MNVSIIDIVEFYEIFPQFKGKISVKTRFGYKKIEEAGITAKNSNVIKIYTECGIDNTCSPDHLWLSNNIEWKLAKDLKIGDVLFREDCPTRVSKIKLLKGRRDLYDLQVEGVHEFFANGIVSHNSSVQESIIFALFGQAYRNLNKPGLINSINQKQCMVTIEFEIGKKTYRVIRGMKPNVFEIYENDLLLNKTPGARDYQKILEQQILKFNYRSFTQSVIIGSGSYVPFMKLSAKDRREFIEDLLDIRIFSMMNLLLKDKIKLTKQTLSDINIEMKSLKDKISFQDAFVKKRMVEKSNDSVRLLAEIESLNFTVNSNTEKISVLHGELTEVKSRMEESDSRDTMYELVGKRKVLVASIEEKRKQQTFYNDLHSCPTCKQNVASVHKERMIKDSESEISRIQETVTELNSSIQTEQTQLKKFDELAIQDAKINSQIGVLESENISCVALIRSKTESIAAVNDIGDLTEEKNSIKEMAKQIMLLDKDKRGVIEDGQYQETISQLLQDDGIKSKIVKQYVPIINKLINKYLDKLNFFVSFHLDENFNETVKSRHRDTFVYENFSEGQKSRVDLALLFAWRDLARMKNSINTNILFLDEIVDGSGDDEMVQLTFMLLSDMKDSNIFVISHRDNIQDKFSRIMEFKLKNNFSTVAEIPQ